MSMKHHFPRRGRRYGLLAAVLLAAGVTSAVIAATSAGAPAKTAGKPTIVLANNSWEGSTANNIVAQYVIQKYLGYKVNLLTIDEIPAWPAMTQGKVSAILQGENVTAAPIGVPARPAPPPAPPPPASAPLAAPRPAPAADLSRQEGALDDSLPDLITAFHLAQQTGELTVQKGKVKKTVFFEKGKPCFAISNLVTDRFGPFLVRVGKISQGQLELCQAAAEKTRRRTGDVLVEMAILKDAERLYYVAQQVKAIIYSIFGWEEGQFRLHFADRAAKETVKIDLHPANLIVRGVKKLYKPARLYRLLSPEDRLLPSQQPAYGLHEVELDRWEAELLPRVDGTRTLAELIHVAGRPEHAVYGFLYSMVALKILERR